MRFAACLVFLLAGCGDGAQVSAPAPVSAQAALSVPVAKPEPYRPDPQFDLIAGELLTDDAAAYARGGVESILGDTLPLLLAPAADVAALYAENQVAGDLRYNQKTVLLTGVIGSINSGLGNTPYIVFRSTGFIGLQAHLSTDDVADAAKLRKGQRISLICVGGGAIAGTPIFKDCQFAEKFAADQGAKLARKIEAFFQGKPVADDVVVLAILLEGMARQLDDAIVCSKTCSELVKPDAANRRQAHERLIRAMREGGLTIPPAAEAMVLQRTS